MAKIVRYFLTIACVMVASDSVLVISNWCRDFVGLMVCILLLLVCWRGLGAELPRRLIVFAGLSVLAGVAFSLNGLVVRLAAVGWVIGFLWLSEGHAITPAADGADASLAVVHLSAVGFAIALAAYGRSASVWFGLERVARAPSIRHLGLAAPATGAWISGLPVWLFGLIALGVATALQGANWRCLICGLGLVAGAAATRAMCAISAVNGPAGIAASQIASVALVAVLLTVASAAGRGAVPERGRRHASRQILGISLALTIAALAVAGLPLSGGHRSPPDRPKSSFLIYPYGLLDWRVPDFERVGLVNAGMFGLFLRLLERDASTSGGEVTMATDRISPGDLLDVGIIVFINPVKELDDREIRAVERFVAAGGGLMVLGDHTNIGGSMRPLNSVLSFTRIRFNFDSAIPVRPHWQGCLEVRQHPVMANLPRGCPPEVLLQIAVGASLTIEPPAYPIVVGRYGFADAGDSLNQGRGACMGNLVHDRGESVGDVVLVAAEQVGRGRVLVFGDTSPFQNGALFLSQRLVSNAIGWLAQRSRPVPSGYGDELALVDFSLAPEARLTLFDKASLGGLANCLARAGVEAVPAFSQAAWRSPAKYLFLVNPTRFGHDDAGRLEVYMREGGNVILAQGFAAAPPCEPLLARFGLAVEDVPLGAGEPGGRVRHKDAWAISCSDTSDAVVRASAFGYPTVVTERVGQGSLTLVSDGGFFLDENLESEERAEPRNLAFVNDLILALRGSSQAASER